MQGNKFVKTLIMRGYNSSSPVNKQVTNVCHKMMFAQQQVSFIFIP